MTDTNTPKVPSACGCGRSPTGKCMGWHAFTEEEFAEAKQQWQIQEDTKRLFGIASGASTSSLGTPKG